MVTFDALIASILLCQETSVNIFYKRVFGGIKNQPLMSSLTTVDSFSQIFGKWPFIRFYFGTPY